MDDLQKPAGSRADALEEAVAIMAHLRGPEGCPWDREQTYDSIKRHTLEETYEVFDAIDRRDFAGLKDELGDLLLQVLFYAQIAEDDGHFAIEDVARNLSAKLRRRHPHIFAGVTAKTADDVNRTWEAVKRQEKAALGLGPSAAYLDAVPQYVPAMLEAQKLGARAAKVGLDWPSAAGLIAKLREETAELEVEVAAGPEARAKAQDELGDLLFTAVNLARHLDLEPEFALRAANRKFRSRFTAIEAAAGGEEQLRASTPHQLELLWAQAKETVG